MEHSSADPLPCSTGGCCGPGAVSPANVGSLSLHFQEGGPSLRKQKQHKNGSPIVEMWTCIQEISVKNCQEENLTNRSSHRWAKEE